MVYALVDGWMDGWMEKDEDERGKKKKERGGGANLVENGRSHWECNA